MNPGTGDNSKKAAPHLHWQAPAGALISAVPPMEIRTAKLDDAQAIAALAIELGYAADEAVMRARLQAILGRPDQHIVVGVADGVVAGWLQASTSDVLESGFRAEIVGLIVSAAYRRRGLGRRLVESAVAWAGTTGAKAVSVRSNVVRGESHSFYPALGFEPVKTQAVYRKRLSSL
jgi:ribosomal protein S18 acetylase RimI-like enzyme